jgi:hypothetical protein
MGTTTETYVTDKPFYRATRDSMWLERALTEAQHLFVKNDDRHMFCAVHQQDASVCAPPTGDLVWYDNLDQETYSAAVTRVAPYRSLLVLTRRETLVLQKKVGMMYNAEFGPDMEDVQQWRRIVLATANEDCRRRGKPPPPG